MQPRSTTYTATHWKYRIKNNRMWSNERSGEVWRKKVQTSHGPSPAVPYEHRTPPSLDIACSLYATSVGPRRLLNLLPIFVVLQGNNSRHVESLDMASSASRSSSTNHSWTWTKKNKIGERSVLSYIRTDVPVPRQILR